MKYSIILTLTLLLSLTPIIYSSESYPKSDDTSEYFREKYIYGGAHTRPQLLSVSLSLSSPTEIQNQELAHSSIGGTIDSAKFQFLRAVGKNEGTNQWFPCPGSCSSRGCNYPPYNLCTCFLPYCDSCICHN